MHSSRHRTKANCSWYRQSPGRSWLNLQYCRNTSSSLVKENQTDLVYNDCELKTGYLKRSQKYWGLLPDFCLALSNYFLTMPIFFFFLSFCLFHVAFSFLTEVLWTTQLFFKFCWISIFRCKFESIHSTVFAKRFFIIVGITSYKFENPHYHSSIYVAMAKIILPISDPHLDTLLMFESTTLWFDWPLFH